MRAQILAIATAALLAFSLPVHAEDASDEVSDAVDIAFWCGAAFMVAADSPDVTAEQKDASKKMSDLAFARAEKALIADGVEESEYERLAKFYVESAMKDLAAGVEDMRYTSDECVAEATAQ